MTIRLSIPYRPTYQKISDIQPRFQIRHLKSSKTFSTSVGFLSVTRVLDFFQLSAKCKRTLKRKLYINTNLARVFKMFSLSFSHTQTVVWAIRPKPFILNRSIRSRHSISLSFSLSTVKALLVCSI